MVTKMRTIVNNVHNTSSQKYRQILNCNHKYISSVLFLVFLFVNSQLVSHSNIKYSYLIIKVSQRFKYLYLILISYTQLYVLE